MSKKQEIVKKTMAAEPPERIAKPRAPRVRAAQHSKAVSGAPMMIAQTVEDPHDVIAQIAYSFWQARGCQAGAELEDWVRAEQEYNQRLAAVRL